MSSNGPQNDKKEGSKILRRVQSLISLEFFSTTQPPSPSPVAASKADKKEIKIKKEKKEKKLKKEHKHDKTEKKEKIPESLGNKRQSRQLFTSDQDELDQLELEMLSRPLPTPPSQIAQAKVGTQHSGRVVYTTHDNFKIRSGDLARYPVTICTNEERMSQIAQETRQRANSTTSVPAASPTPLDILIAAPPPPVLSRRGSVILNTTIPLTDSMKKLQDAVASLELTNEKKKVQKPAP